MRLTLLLITLSIILFSCSITKSTPTKIGVVTIPNYIIDPSTPLPDSVNYMFFTDKENFNRYFTLTKSAPGNMKIPDFTSQSVIAIALQPGTGIEELQISKAEIEGKDVNIYYKIMKSEGSTFPHTTTAVAAIPKANDLRQAHFYDSVGRRKTLPVTF
jgi:hypothetical protein